MVEKRQADFVSVDPEDLYVAFQMKNEDFAVFSEIRTTEEPDGIIDLNSFSFSIFFSRFNKKKTSNLEKNSISFQLNSVTKASC